MLPPEKDDGRDETSPQDTETPPENREGGQPEEVSPTETREESREAGPEAAARFDPAPEDAAPPAGRDAPAEAAGDTHDPTLRTESETPMHSEPVAEPAAETERPAPAAPPARSGGGFWAALLAAIVGGAIGAGGIWYWLQQQEPTGPDPQITAALEQQESAVAAQGERVAAIESDIGSLNEALSDTDLSDAIEQLRVDAEGRLEGVAETLAAVGERLNAVERQLDEQAGRIAELEARPVADPETATEVLRSEVADMRAEVEEATQAARAQVEAMRSELAAAAEETQAQVVAAEERAAQIEAEAQQRLADAEAEAQAKARGAEAQAALAQVEVALDSGEPYAEELSTLAANIDGGVPVSLFEAAETGVPTVGELRESFPDAARVALRQTAVATTEGDPGDRFLAFLRTQTQARSLTPQEGDSPDAILSRAEAALDEGQVQAALAELEALPEDGRAAMQEWIAAARTRAAAVEAARSMSQQTN